MTQTRTGKQVPFCAQYLTRPQEDNGKQGWVPSEARSRRREEAMQTAATCLGRKDPEHLGWGCGSSGRGGAGRGGRRAAVTHSAEAGGHASRALL